MMGQQMQALYVAVRLLLRTRYRVKAAEQAQRREQRLMLPRWNSHDRLDELADELTRARACRQEAEDEVLLRWEEFSQDHDATDHSPPPPTSREPGPDKA